jgi:hypothetical protein
MNQPPVNRVAEACHHNNRNHKRKAKVEVSVDQPVSTQNARRRAHNSLLAH